MQKTKIIFFNAFYKSQHLYPESQRWDEYIVYSNQIPIPGSPVWLDGIDIMYYTSKKPFHYVYTFEDELTSVWILLTKAPEPNFYPDIKLWIESRQSFSIRAYMYMLMYMRGRLYVNLPKEPTMEDLIKDVKQKNLLKAEGLGKKTFNEIKSALVESYGPTIFEK